MSQQQAYNPYYPQQPPYQGQPGQQPPPYGFQPPPQQPPPFMAPPPGAGMYGGNADPEAAFVKDTGLGFSNASVRAGFVRKVHYVIDKMTMGQNSTCNVSGVLFVDDHAGDRCRPDFAVYFQVGLVV